MGLVFDQNGNLYIEDKNNHRVQKFSIDVNQLLNIDLSLVRFRRLFIFSAILFLNESIHV